MSRWLKHRWYLFALLTFALVLVTLFLLCQHKAREIRIGMLWQAFLPNLDPRYNQIRVGMTEEEVSGILGYQIRGSTRLGLDWTFYADPKSPTGITPTWQANTLVDLDFEKGRLTGKKWERRGLTQADSPLGKVLVSWYRRTWRPDPR
jgi:hypothetical protein